MTHASEPSLVDFDPTDPRVLADPYRLYQEARELCPVNHHRLPDAEVDKISANPLVAQPTTGYYSLFRYRDIKAVAQNHQVYSSLGAGGPERIVPPNEVGMLVYADEPHHRMQRQIINKALSPRMVTHLEPRIRALCDDLVDEVFAQGSAEMVAGYANEIPGNIFAELLGVPTGDRVRFKRWAEDLVAAFGGDADSQNRSIVAMQEIFVYFSSIIGERRERIEAGGELPDDLLSAMLVTEYEGRTFNDLEMLLAIHIFLIGGHETTASGIAGMIHQFARHPDQLALVRGDRTLVPNAIEEVLRYETPVQCMFRLTKADTEVSDVAIPYDEKVRIVYSSANRDPEVFTDPEAFDVTRNVTELRRHLAFGTGIHSCVGAALARLEMRIALETLLDRLGAWELDPGRENARGDSLLVRRFATLHIRWAST